MNKREQHGTGALTQDNAFDLDSNGYLIYWDTTQRRYILLEPTARILDPNIFIGKVGQQNILPQHLCFKQVDFHSTTITNEEGFVVGQPIPPGISAFILFHEYSENNQLRAFARTHLYKEMHTKSRLHITQGRDVAYAGWKIYFAPLIDRGLKTYSPLHVILVPQSILQGMQEPTFEERQQLAQAFVRY